MTSLILPATAGISAWAVYLSAVAIKDVKQYEEMTQQTAKVSAVADDQLQSTRTTQAAGALASVLSLASALTFTLYPNQSPKWHVGMAVASAAAAFFASDHITKFWHGKSKVPMVDQYNDAIDKSNNLRRVLAGLGALWLADSGLQTWTLLTQ